MQPITWLGLGYNVPVNPSKNRVYVWRKLKELGAGYFKQGVAILPKSPQNFQKFSGLAGKIREMGGDATLVELRFVDAEDEARTIARFKSQSTGEYQELMRDCATLLEGMKKNIFAPDERNDLLKRMVKRYGKVKSRDYFRSRSDLADGLDDLVEDMAHVTDEIARQMKNILDV